MDKETAHEIWRYLNEKYGAASDDHDDFKAIQEIHEDGEHIHDMVVVEDCSTSWSSDDDDDDDDQCTTSSLDMIDGDDSSAANDDPTPSTLDDQVGSYMDDISTSSSSPSSHCFRSQGDTKVSNCNVIDPNSYNELLNRYASMNKLFEKVLAKTIKLEKENSFLKDTCEQQKHLLYVMSCSHEELKLTHEELSVAHENLVLDHALLSSKFSNKEIKTSESSSHGSKDQLQNIANPCDVGKKHVSTSCDDLLSMPCTSHIDACSSSTMQYETNLVEENKELQSQVKYLSNKIERWTKSKVTLESIIKNQRNFGDMSGIGSNKSKAKGKRWGKNKYDRKMKKQEEMKLSHFMCFQCHEMGHFANGCPNKENLKLKKEEEKIKHVKCFNCRTWGHLTSMCPTKQLVKQQEAQPKPQVEQEKAPQPQVKINHDDQVDDLKMMKKRTRRGGKARARHPTHIQDAKMLSKNKIQDKNPHAHIKCHSCAILGHLASGCPNKLEKKAQANNEKQGNEKHQMSKEGKAQQKRRCYLCREKGHMAYSCPLGNNSKPISIDAHIMLRKDGNGTSFVAITKHPAIHTKALPKYVAPNLRGPNLVWVPSKRG
jgi:hypothetical protein